MNADDLARLLEGANITINIQSGTGNTMYTAPVQNNTYNTYNNHAARRAPRCKICGRSGGADLYKHLVGYSHQSCIEKQGEEARRLRAERQAGLWPIVKSTPNELSAASTEQDELDPLEQWDIYALEYLLRR